MAWCENCKKTGLRKDDVEFDETFHKILCHGCYAYAHPGWVPPLEYVDMTSPRSVQAEVMPVLNYSVSFDNKNGFRAQLSYGDLALQFQAPMDQLKKYLGPA